jgi:hypothetical protein
MASALEFHFFYNLAEKPPKDKQVLLLYLRTIQFNQSINK